MTDVVEELGAENNLALAKLRIGEQATQMADLQLQMKDIANSLAQIWDVEGRMRLSERMRAAHAEMQMAEALLRHYERYQN